MGETAVAWTGKVSSSVDVAGSGKPTTSSLIVAEAFGKEHFNVLQSIEALECSSEFAELNFQVCSYKPVNATRSYPMYQITRDGFSFLVMGFTGINNLTLWR